MDHIEHKSGMILSKMSKAAYPIKALTISVTCKDKVYAQEHAERIRLEIQRHHETALEKGWDYSNSPYQNIRIIGTTLTYEYFYGFIELLYTYREPLAEYNQHEDSRISSVTFKYLLEDNVADSVNIFRDSFQKAVNDNEIDNFNIEGLSISITSSGPDPFKRLIRSHLEANEKWVQLRKTKASVEEIQDGMKSSMSRIMFGVAIIILIAIFIKSLI